MTLHVHQGVGVVTVLYVYVYMRVVHFCEMNSDLLTTLVLLLLSIILSGCLWIEKIMFWLLIIF